jgi:hypothetical protein
MNDLLAVVLAFALPSAAQPLDASRVIVSNAAVLASFSTEQVRGFPVLMSWSPDGRQLSVRVVQRDRWANEKTWFYVLALGDSQLTSVEREPDWTGGYWLSKSALSCPGAPAFHIEVETRVERRTATSSGAGGAIAQNSGDPYGAGFELGPQGQAIIQGAMQSQQVSTTTMKLKGAVLGEFVNTPAIPGLMYSWAPAGMDAIAYANGKRALVVMDNGGRRHEVRGSKGVLLPAWSPDGKRVAWLEQQGRKKFALMVAEVTAR